MVTIIVTFHNNQKDMIQCLESIVNQTYKDTEVILVNDGSEDGTAEICKKYMEQYSFISYQYVDHQGVSVARNRGIELANGEYIMFVDGDDYLDETIIECLIKHMDETVDIICCGCVAFDDTSGLEEKCHFFCGNLEFATDDEKEDLYCQLLDVNYGQAEGYVYTAIGVPWGKLYRTSFLRNNQFLFSKDLKRMQDNVFNMYAFQKARKIVYYDMPLYWYRVNHIMSYKKAYAPEIYFAVAKERHNFFTNILHNYSKKLADQIQRMYVKTCMVAIKNIALTYPLRSAKTEIAKQCEISFYKKAIENIQVSMLSSTEKLQLHLMRKKHFYFLIIIRRVQSKLIH